MKNLQAPDMVTWEITEKCNMYCKHCSNSINGQPVELDTESCKSIIKSITNANVLKVGIEGGEPFCRNDMLDLIEFMNYNKISPSIATNGTLLNEMIVSDLESRNISSLQISLDGSSKGVYSRLRKKPELFDHVINNIVLAVKHHLPVTLAMVVTKSTFSDIPSFAELAKSLDVDKVRFIDYVPAGRGTLDECLSVDEIKEAYQLMCEIEETGLSVITPNKLMSLLKARDGETLLGFINPGIGFGCEAGTAIAHIRANGDVTPCSFFREKEFIAGNMIEANFLSIWQNSPVFRSFRQISPIPENCESCEENHSCCGGCRAYAYYSSGSLQSIDPRCWRLKCTR